MLVMDSNTSVPSPGYEALLNYTAINANAINVTNIIATSVQDTSLTPNEPVLTDATSTLVSGQINLASSSFVTNTLAVANGGTNSSTALNNNRFIISSGNKIVEQSAQPAFSIVECDTNGLPIGVSLTDAQMIFGKTGSAPTLATLTTTNGMVLPTNAGWNCSTPQDIQTTASPTFENLTLNTATPVILMTDTGNNGATRILAGVGGTYIESGVGSPILAGPIYFTSWFAGSVYWSMATNGALTGQRNTMDDGSGNLSTSANITVGGLSNSMPVKTNGLKQLVSSAISLTTDISSVLPVANGGTNSSTALNNNRVMISSGGKIVEESALTALGSLSTDSNGLPTSTAMTDGQLIIGKTGSAPQYVTLTTTTGMTLPGAGSYQIDTPQDLRTSARPTFTVLNIVNANDAVLYYNCGVGWNNWIEFNNSLHFAAQNASVYWTMGSNGSLVGINNTLDDGSGNLSTSANITVGGLTASMPVLTNGAKKLVSGAISLTTGISGVLPVANGGNNSSSALTNGKIMVSSAGAIVEGTSSTTPTFTHVICSDNTIGSGSYANVLTLPAVTDTVVTNAYAGVLSNKDFIAANCDFVDKFDNTKKITFTCGANTSGVSYLLRTVATTNKTASFPDLTGNVLLDTSAPTCTGDWLWSDTTDSSSISTGTLVCDGGIGIAKTMYIGSDIHMTGANAANANTGLFLGNVISAGGYAGLMNSSIVPNGANYSLLQDTSGNTFINASTGESVYIRVNNSSIATFNPTNSTFTSQVNETSTTDSSSTATGSIITAGGLGVAKTIYVGTGVYLPTTGGTASLLNYYQEETISISFTGLGFTASTNVTFVRVGKAVTVNFLQNVGASTISTTMTAAAGSIPARYAPSGTTHVFGSIRNNSNFTLGMVTIGSGGDITIHGDSGVGNFTGAGTEGFNTFSVSWNVI